MELKHFDIKDLTSDWADIATFAFPHISVRLTFTSNWEKKFTIFITDWQEPTVESAYSFENYDDAWNMLAALYATNKEAIMMDFEKVKEEFSFTQEEKDAANNYLKNS